MFFSLEYQQCMSSVKHVISFSLRTTMAFLYSHSFIIDQTKLKKFDHKSSFKQKNKNKNKQIIQKKLIIPNKE